MRSLALLRHERVIDAVSAPLGWPRTQTRPSSARRRDACRSCRTACQADMRAQIQVSGAEAAAHQVVSFGYRAFEHLHDTLIVAVAHHGLTRRRYGQSHRLIAGCRLHRSGGEETANDSTDRADDSRERGARRASGKASAGYAQIAAPSVMTLSPCRRAGTLPIGLMARYAGAFMLVANSSSSVRRADRSPRASSARFGRVIADGCKTRSPHSRAFSAGLDHHWSFRH